MKNSFNIENFPQLYTLERLHYEVTTRQNILNFMSLNDMRETDNYKNFFEEHIIYLKIYEDLKIDFYNWMLSTNIIDYNFKGTWNINFRMKEVEISD